MQNTIADTIAGGVEELSDVRGSSLGGLFGNVFDHVKEEEGVVATAGFEDEFAGTCALDLVSRCIDWKICILRSVGVPHLPWRLLGAGCSGRNCCSSFQDARFWLLAAGGAAIQRESQGMKRISRLQRRQAEGCKRM